MTKAAVCAAVLGLLTCAGTAGAATIHVDVGGGGDYTTIQAGMDAAAGGDTVLVESGTYYLDTQIQYGGKEILVLGHFGPENTIIDCQGTSRGVRFNGEGPDAKLVGFTIQNGSAGYGGGIQCEGGTSATISDCIVRDCSAERGGGIQIYQSNVSVMATEITGCTATDRGGAVSCSNCTASTSLIGLVMGNNTAAYGGGMHIWGGNPWLSMCTFYRNSAPQGGAIECESASPTILQSIMAFSTQGKGVYCQGTSTPDITYCDIYGSAGGDDVCGTTMGNGNEDPRFCDIDEGDVRLCANSACLPGGISLALIGARGQGCADCTAPVGTTTWGAVKALYR